MGGGDPSNQSDPILPGALCVLFLLWNIQIFGNTVHCAYCKMVGCWHYYGSGEDAVEPASDHPTNTTGPCTFYLHAWTYHLGSICFGSLIVAFIGTLRWIASALEDRESRNNNGGAAGVVKMILLSILRCLLAFVEEVVDFVNKIAYVHVGVKNVDFVSGAKSVMELFKSWSGLRLVVQSSLVDSVLLIGRTVCIGLCLLAGWITAKTLSVGTSSSPEIQIVGFVLCAILAFMVVSDTVCMIDSGVIALYVLYAEDPVKMRVKNSAMVQEVENRRAFCLSNQNNAEGGAYGTAANSY